MMKGTSKDDSNEKRKNGVNKILNAPVHLGAMAANLEDDVEQIKSIWVTTRDDSMVNRKKKIEICILLLSDDCIKKKFCFIFRK